MKYLSCEHKESQSRKKKAIITAIVNQLRCASENDLKGIRYGL